MSEEMRKCGCGGEWVYCDGDCCSCDVPIVYMSNRTELEE